MCTPIGHTLAGAIVVKQSRLPFPMSRWQAAALLLVIANWPDIDFFFGIFGGNPNHYHQGWTHSLLFVLISGAVFGGFYALKHGYSAGAKAGLLAFSVMVLHLICDILGGDTRPPIGIPLFWPFSEVPVHSPVTLFGSVTKASDTLHFIPSLFCWHNLRVVIQETGIMLAVFGLLQLTRRRR